MQNLVLKDTDVDTYAKEVNEWHSFLNNYIQSLLAPEVEIDWSRVMEKKIIEDFYLALVSKK